MIWPPERSHVVLCPDAASYQTAVEAHEGIPVIARTAVDLCGFGRDLVTRPFAASASAPAGHGVPRSPDADRVCLVVAEPSCAAAARLLATRSGRLLHAVAAEDDWDAALDAVLADSPRTLTLVFPGWDAAGRATPVWLMRSLHAMRARHAALRRTAWGLLTAADPATLSRLVAKALLQDGVMVRYRDEPAYVLTTDDYGAEPALPRFAAGSAAPLQVIDLPQLQDGRARALVDRPGSALFVKTHGRSYCACDGYLCGARPILDDPRAPATSCVMGLDCASPQYPRIDPRRYDVPIALLDSCASANWASPVWETGLPVLAYYALAGSPSAVITSDGLCLDPAGNLVDGLWALTSAPTMGEATRRLNAVREYAGAVSAYFLLGDPEIPAGVARWPRWTSPVMLDPAESTATDRHAVAGTVRWPEPAGPFVRVLLAKAGVEAEEAGDPVATTTFVHDPEGALDTPVCRRFDGADGAELWLGSAGHSGLSTLTVESRITPRLSAELCAAAAGIRERVRSWSRTFDEATADLVAAGEAIVTVGRTLDRLAGQAVPAPPESVDLLTAGVIDQWVQAQAGAVRQALRLAPRGLWPTDVWASDEYRSETVARACPCCGLAPMLDRTYASAPGPRRQWRECMRCDIVEDRPLVEGFPGVGLEAPAELGPGERGDVVITIEGRGDAGACGAGGVAVAGTGHGVSVNPAVFVVAAGDGRPRTVVVRMSVADEGPAIAHLYRLRVLLLLNGHWHWASRFLTVRNR